MVKVANMAIWGRGLSGYIMASQKKNHIIVGYMFGDYHSLCTLKTSIVDMGKEKEHCSRYKSQNLWNLLKSPHMPSSPPWPIAFIIEQTIDHKSLTNVWHIQLVSSTPRHSSNRVSILNCGYRH